MSNDLTTRKDWYSEIPRSTRKPTIFGFAIFSVAILGFGAWGGTAPIAGAIVTTGSFVTTGNNKVIQHLEGGVISDILVREGDLVTPGQALVMLDDTAPRAELQRLVLRRARAAAVEARLTAEIREQAEIVFPDYLLSRIDDPDIAAIVASQRLSFEARRNHLRAEIGTIEKGIEALRERIQGGRTQIKAVEAQLAFFSEELEVKQKLLVDGMIRRSEVLALQRAHANMQGEIGRLLGDIGDARERIARAEEQIGSLRSSVIKSAVEQLHEVNADLNDLRERIRSAENIMERVSIVAPVEGIVVKLRYHTSGGVIEAGKNIMEIVPQDEKLIIEARVRPQDIDGVKRGQKAMIRLTALNQRVTPMVEGRVIYVSADALPDERFSERMQGDLYVARVELDPSSTDSIKDFQPTPGMPAEVYIETLERTFFQYLAQPLRDSMARAFRES
ncbi:MAG TPA: HlyD family type I secretion periplasmic adaptor subunit [Saliniramus sp.]|nr:HlyD family type I secretion periplasmic adaptor subunit [Saliniramus sp.]